MGVLYFDASSNLKDLMGRKLVTNKISAIFELVKNSFDADAKEVYVTISNDHLIIEDTGKGMTLDDIRDKWMVIGTDNKKGKAVTDNGRPLNGEKGIGRFAVDRLGRHLTLFSSTGSSNETIRMDFDWGLFEDQSNLKMNEVPIEFTVIPQKRNAGVVLEISNLRDEWNKKEVENLEKRLRGLLSPLTQISNDKFEIFLDCKEFGFFNKKLQPFDLKDISSLWLEVSIPDEDVANIHYTVHRNGVVVEKAAYKNTYNFGPIKVVMYSFDQGDKVSFSKRFGEKVKEFGNVRIYRDCFQIYPYGEVYNDWLDLELRKSQGHFRFLGVRDLIGYIQISRLNNPQFMDATNRQGLEENQALEDLRDFVKKQVIGRLEDQFFFKKNKNNVVEEKQAKVEIVAATKTLKDIAVELKTKMPEQAKQVLELTKVIQNNHQKQDKIIREQRQMVDVYKRLASKETLLQGIMHEALIKLQSIQTAIWNQRTDMEGHMIPEELYDLLFESQENIIKTVRDVNQSLLGARKYLLKKRQVESIKLIDEINKIFKKHQSVLAAENIEIDISGPQDMFIKFDKNDMEVIFDNLISNSVKSLKQTTTIVNRAIEVRVEPSMLRTNIFFKDNGIGISEEDIPHIFNAYYTTNKDGFGMGLAIVDDLVKANNGEINLVKQGVGESRGAIFQLTF